MNLCKDCEHWRSKSATAWFCAAKGLRFATSSGRIGCTDDFSPWGSRAFSGKDLPDISYKQVNNPIQIQHVVIGEKLDLLTMLLQDGSIRRGKAIAGYADYTWEKIALPTDKPVTESECNDPFEDLDEDDCCENENFGGIA